MTTVSREPSVIELTVAGRRYSMVLPHAERDYIQKKIASDRQPYELEMLEDLGARLKTGDLVLDVGANVGNHTLYLAAVVGCRVEAFEPNEQLCDAIEASLELSGVVSQVRVHRHGVGDAVGFASFESDRPDNLGAQRLKLHAGDIPVRPLDDLQIGPEVKAIKIDVEGMEADVLQGATRLIDRDRPMLYVECQREPEFRRICRWLELRNYGYWESFNATPTHLFLPAESVTTDQRLNRLLGSMAIQQYRFGQQWTALKKLLPAPSPVRSKPEAGRPSSSNVPDKS